MERHASAAVLLAETAGLDAIVAEGLAVMQMDLFLSGRGSSDAELAAEAQRTAERLDDSFLSGTVLLVGALARACTGDAETAQADSRQALWMFAQPQFARG